jgi:hypothetical protein
MSLLHRCRFILALCASLACHRGTRLTVQGSPCGEPPDCQRPYVCDPVTRTCQFALAGADAAPSGDGPGATGGTDAAGDASAPTSAVPDGAAGATADAAADASAPTSGAPDGAAHGAEAAGLDVSPPAAACRPDAAAESCSPGYATCGGATCGVFLPTDRHNCGECGHGCGDDACQDGRCEPVLVHSTQEARVLAVNRAGVYFATPGGDLLRVASGGKAEVLSTGEGDVGALVASSQALYVLVRGGGKCPMGSCLRRLALVAGAQSTFLTGAGPYSSLAADEKAVYWFSGGAIYRLPAQAVDDSVEPQPIVTSAGQISTLAIDEEYAYWGDWRDPEPGSPAGPKPGVVRRAWLEGGRAPEPLVVGRGRFGGVAVDGRNVYWTDLDDGTLSMAPKQGGPATPLPISSQYPPVGVLSDERNVYWTSAGGLRRATLCGGPGQDLVVGYNDGMLVFDHQVYYASHPVYGLGGGIFRVAP